jgi:ribosomal protein L40E
LAWLSAIQRKAGGIVPEVPVPTASSHSNPNQRRYGKPKTDVERIMAHYGISKEEAERLISETMRVYGVGREEAIKALLPPRGAKVKGSSNAERVAYWEVVYWTPEKPETKFRRPFPIDRERAKVWKKMLEERGYEARIMPVYEKASSNQKQCRICFYPLPEGAEKCPRCLSPVKKE